MRYVSTRNRHAAGVSLADAIVAGLAPDGGLFIPDEMPRVAVDELVGADQATVARALLNAFRDDDSPPTDAAITHAFQWPVRLAAIGEATEVLELYWGPSSAFKDYGAQFLAHYLTGLEVNATRRVTVMVATSGDTGGAVAAAFWRKPDVDVFVLFPEGRVSARQEHQLCAWGDNIRSIAVRGSFDECQALVKAAFKDPYWTEGRYLTSANSINVGRLLPQAAYYAWSSLDYRRRHGAEPGYVIPTGNLGNALACIWAREVGFPIGDIVLATNANPTLRDYQETGEWQPRASVPTLANAMDVGNPSNMERLGALFPTHDEFLSKLRIESVDDETIEEVIRNGEERWGRVFDPHTACAVHVRETIGGSHWILAATAHPAKFETIVEPLIGHTIEVPPALAEILAKPAHKVTIDPTLGALRDA